MGLNGGTKCELKRSTIKWNDVRYHTLAYTEQNFRVIQKAVLEFYRIYGYPIWI